jgi:hypothetical protein
MKTRQLREDRATLEVVKKKDQGAILYRDNYNYVLEHLGYQERVDFQQRSPPTVQRCR